MMSRARTAGIVLIHPVRFSGSPFRVPVRDTVDPSKVKCSGPGLGPVVRAHVPQDFTVDSRQAGQAPLDVKLFGPSGKSSTSAECCEDISSDISFLLTI